MISALQKSQNEKSKQQTSQSTKQTVRLGAMDMSRVNPLDSTSVIKRGKEKENPKAKKKSTLKKVCIRKININLLN